MDEVMDLKVEQMCVRICVWMGECVSVLSVCLRV
jgi:hypothetical protein